MSSYVQEEVHILQYLLELMRATGLPALYIHVLNDLLREATIDTWDGGAGRVLMVTRESKQRIENMMGPDTPTPMHAAISAFQRAGIIQMWRSGGYRLNPDIFGRRLWYVNGRSRIHMVKLRVKRGRREKKLTTVRIYRGVLRLPMHSVGVYRMAEEGKGWIE